MLSSQTHIQGQGTLLEPCWLLCGANIFCLTLTFCIARKSWQIGSGRGEQVVLQGRPVEVLGPIPFELRHSLRAASYTWRVQKFYCDKTSQALDA